MFPLAEKACGFFSRPDPPAAADSRAKGVAFAREQQAGFSY
jgi:hypothetical protein